MIKELTLTILLVTGSPQSIPAGEARTIVKYGLQNCVNTKQNHFQIKWRKVKWVKRRYNAIKRSTPNTNISIYYRWDDYVFRQVRLKKLKRDTNFIYIFDIAGVLSQPRGGLSYVCEGWNTDADAIVWGSHSRLDVPFIDMPLDVNAALFCHEIGHASGRLHCGDRYDVMHPYFYYTGNIPLKDRTMCDGKGVRICKRFADNFSPFGCGFKH